MKIDKCEYHVQGMHCASCELLIEKKIISLDGVNSVDASTNKSSVVVEYEDDKKPSSAKLNKIFSKDGYRFAEFGEAVNNEKTNWSDYLNSVAIAAVLIFGFVILNNSGFSGLVNISAKSSLPVFFLFGLLAGCSTCAALVGGIVLSMTKSWTEQYSEPERQSKAKSPLLPHLLFNSGRILSFTILGGVLGVVGSRLQLSFSFTSLLVFVVSIMMIFLGLQMLGIKSLTFSMPKSLSRFSTNEKNFTGKFAPFLMGAATFLLPCGFTITVEGIALLTGNVLGGALVMLMFVLGTTIPLLAIGLSSLKFFENKTLAGNFSRVAGILVLFFALFNINNQLNFWGLPSFSNISVGAYNYKPLQKDVGTSRDLSLPEIENGKQILKMSASAYGYTPNALKVRAGIPVSWQITDTGTSGCTSGLIARDFLKEPINLTPGKTSTVEFTPTQKGTYRFSCWMGMVNGTIKVI
jgi:uncharacterized protein